jgi:hypothetical protein
LKGGNCGLFVSADSPLTVDARHNFWGASSGPDPNPADTVCVDGKNFVTTEPFAAKERPAK